MKLLCFSHLRNEGIPSIITKINLKPFKLAVIELVKTLLKSAYIIHI